MSDTIAAIATPFGQGAIAVVRLSGGEALEVAGRAAGLGEISGWKPRMARLAHLFDGRGEVLDEVVITA
ncbi:MAG: tRNA uridine-5-carboxymethylaminomethyl(34) synthesis GTPase MnmE, partial [Akkermansiaceae bacterium]|nr:tRNA uridine-5-carboxymethylaminomethyl(34) synthesis GTPase MnmE [Akkermansiaceae bacterium]